MLLVNTNSKEKVEKEIEKMLSMLRRVYDVIEMSHLTDHKMINTYCRAVHFPRTLGSDIFGYLQAKDSTFRELVIKRQKRYRNLQKKKKFQQEMEQKFPKLVEPTVPDFERFAE